MRRLHGAGNGGAGRARDRLPRSTWRVVYSKKNRILPPVKRSVHGNFLSSPDMREGRILRARSAAAVTALLLCLLLGAPLPARAQEVPDWFAQSFLELPEDVAEAAQDGKRVMLYFWQEGCPYCEQLVNITFRDPDIVARMRSDFVPLAINIRGDREVTWTDGSTTSEKRFAPKLGVWGTPTLIFLDERGDIALRLHGYVAPAEFAPALDRAAPKRPR